MACCASVMAQYFYRINELESLANGILKQKRQRPFQKLGNLDTSNLKLSNANPPPGQNNTAVPCCDLLRKINFFSFVGRHFRRIQKTAVPFHSIFCSTRLATFELYFDLYRLYLFELLNEWKPNKSNKRQSCFHEFLNFNF